MDADKSLFDQRKLLHLWNDVIKPELFGEIINTAQLGATDIEFSTSIIENNAEIDHIYPWHEEALMVVQDQIFKELEQNKYQNVCVEWNKRELMISCGWYPDDY